MADQNKINRLIAKLSSVFMVITLSGCFGDGVQSTIRPHSDNTQTIMDVYSMVTFIDIGIFVVVFGLLIFALIRFREKNKDDIPKQVHGNTFLELLWTLVPTVLLIFIAVPTWVGIFRAADPPATGTIKIEAIGHQWWFEFNYPGLGVVSGNEMHVPINKPIVVDTKSVDVIHSFWIPKLVGKIDMVPGKTNMVWFTPNTVGLFNGQCAEFCGTSHANMRFRVIVETEEEFNAWLEKQKKAPVASNDDARAGQKLFMQKACMACHTISGVPGAVGKIGPNLTNLKNRKTLASSIMDNTPENLAKWIRDPQAMKPGALMMLPIPVSEEESHKLAAFLLSDSK